MSEWLTTGQMIDQLKVGEVAEAFKQHEEKKSFSVKRTTLFNEPFKNLDTGDVLHFNQPLFECKWRILPKYVTFEEAMKALKEGKSVYYQGKNNWNHKITTKEFKVFSLSGLSVKGVGLESLINGAWTIEGDIQ